jgi:cytochrome c biogenesis protein CcmG/thiol:disulfide interchange protein DsbE
MHRQRQNHCKLATCLVLAAALLVTTKAQAHNILQLGKAAPAVVLATLDGRHIASKDLLGHTVILTFWASWCDPCREELPILSRYAMAHAHQGLRVLAFSLDDSDNLAQVRRIAKNLSFPVGLLGQSSVQGYGRMWRIPVSFVIDRAGILRYDGWQASQPAWTASSLKKIVDPLLPQTLGKE